MTARIVQIIADTLGLEVEAVGAGASMERLPEWDSVAHLNVIVSVEQEFGVNFDASELADSRSVVAIEETLRRHGK